MNHIVTHSPRSLRRLDGRQARLFMLAIVLVGLLLGVASQSAFATSHHDPVTACYNVTNGTLRYAEDGACRNGEAALAWPSTSDLTALEAALDAALQAADAALANEATARVAGDSAEATARQGADAALQTQLTALDSRMTALESRVTALETENAAQATTIQLLQQGLAQEITDRRNGDTTTLAGAIQTAQTEITNERNDRIASVGEVRGIAGKLWEAIRAMLGDNFGGAAQMLEGVATQVGHVVGTVVEQLSAKFQGMLDAIQDVWDNLWCFFSDEC